MKIDYGKIIKACKAINNVPIITVEDLLKIIAEENGCDFKDELKKFKLQMKGYGIVVDMKLNDLDEYVEVD